MKTSPYRHYITDNAYGLLSMTLKKISKKCDAMKASH